MEYIDLGYQYDSPDIATPATEEEKIYPELYINSMQGYDGLAVGETQKVVFKVKKTRASEEEGGKYSCTYKILAMKPPVSSDLGATKSIPQ